MVNHLAEGRGKSNVNANAEQQQPDLRTPRTGTRKLQSAAALRTRAPDGRGLGHEEDSKGRRTSVLLKAPQLQTVPSFLPATGTALKGRKPKERYHL